ncbi:MAG TPA: MlaD family protein [Acidobacteriaceae bacterium]|nr:MlaD family protein [Acidobacteriaceae bacterium]
MPRTARLGAFILGTLVILAIGIFIIGSKKYLFTPTYQLKTRFHTVAGLQAGADILVGGVHSGAVRSIDLPSRPGDEVLVTLEMDNATHRIVKQDSTASIQTEGLLGNQYVAVSFGSPGKPDVKSGDFINSIAPLEMNALIEKANGILSKGNEAMIHINEVAAHFSSVSAKIDNGRGTVGALINDRDVYNNLNQTVSSLKETASTAQGTISSAQAGVKDFQDNMEALKHNFLLRGYFKNRGYEDSADLGKDEIAALPQGAAAKEFTFQAKDLFDKRDSAKLKGQKHLNEAGQYLAAQDFAVAVIQVSTGSSGSTDEDMTLAQGRALVVRNYIVQHFGFDDTHLKTLSVGKQTSESSKDDWGLVKVLVYPAGTEMPADKSQQPSENSKEQTAQPTQQSKKPKN